VEIYYKIFLPGKSLQFCHFIIQLRFFDFLSFEFFIRDFPTFSICFLSPSECSEQRSNPSSRHVLHDATTADFLLSVLRWFFSHHKRL